MDRAERLVVTVDGLDGLSEIGREAEDYPIRRNTDGAERPELRDALEKLLDRFYLKRPDDAIDAHRRGRVGTTDASQFPTRPRPRADGDEREMIVTSERRADDTLILAWVGRIQAMPSSVVSGLYPESVAKQSRDSIRSLSKISMFYNGTRKFPCKHFPA
jgi:hypothetical protein